MSDRTGYWRRLVARVKSHVLRKRGYGTATGPRLSLECLEDRRLLSISSVELDADTSTLYILGSDEADAAVVSELTPNVISVRYDLDGAVARDDFDKSQVQLIIFFGNEGDDQFLNQTNVASRAHGGGGNDELSGGAGADEFFGNDGDDLLRGGDGDDVLRGEAGNDRLEGGNGNDNLQGGDDNDEVLGGANDDTLFGGTGDDELTGASGDDSLIGNEGNDVLRGGNGNDTLRGDAGNDTLYGDSGDDMLWGDAGSDTLYGDSGNDTLRGGLNNDALLGGIGDDSLYGDGGNDFLDGERGDDVLRGGEGDDRLYGNIDTDQLFGDAGDDRLLGGDGNDLLRGGDGNDLLYGEVGNDTIFGDVGSDHLEGGLGGDTLYGDEGDDTLDGSEGDDLLVGGTGDDRLLGSEGNDSLHGQYGHDFLQGGLGNDKLNGDDGDDVLVGAQGDDTLTGGLGDDVLYGNEGNDSLYGREGHDILIGHDGNDFLSGGEGNDLLLGGYGNDELIGQAGDDVLRGAGGNDLLRGDEGNDELTGGNGDDQLLGHEGNDRLLGFQGNDTLIGGPGVDRLFGGIGNDELQGGEEGDLLVGEEGDDLLFGEEGNDVLIGGEAVDSLRGNEGEDLLVGATVTHSQAALDLLLATWNSGDAYEARLQALEDQNSPAHLEVQETVFDDYVSDSVLGGAGRDWFFLPGILPIYDPLGIYAESEADPSAGHQHPANIVHNLPVVEGFDLIDSLDTLGDKEADESLSTLIPHANEPVKSREHLALFQLVRYDQVTHTAVSSGAWSDASTWQDGVVPSDGSRVLIPVGVEVAVDRVITASPFSIRVDGKLSFANTANTELRVDTMIVSHAGSLEIGTAEQPIAPDVTARLVFTDNGPIDRSFDPFGISRGLITHGSVSMYGAEVTSHAELVGPITAGTSLLQLDEVPIGWRVGDQIVIAGTQEGQNQDESRTILGILGALVMVEPLSYEHLTPSPELNVHVANVTRNVILVSQGSAPDRRGHAMFMHNRDVDIHYAGFYRLGRTDKFQPVNDPVVNEDWELLAGTGTNPRARYPVHFHRNGTLINGNPSVVQGSVVVDSSGWGFVNHSSYVDIVDNVAYNVNGAAFVTEVGDETGSFVGNIALSTHGSGEGVESRQKIQDFGHAGDGFWFQSSGISVVDNVSAGSDGNAFIFYSRGLKENGVDKAHFLTANLPDPSIAQGADTLLADFVPVRDFHGNIGYAASVGLTVEYNLLDATHLTQSVFQDSTFWNNETGVDLLYSQQIILRDLKIIHDTNESRGEIGVGNNGVTNNVIYDNLTVDGYFVGIDVARRGASIVNGGLFAARIAFLIRPPTEEDRLVLIQGPIEFRELPPGLAAPGLTEVYMRFEEFPLSHIPGIDHLFYNNSVILNHGPYTSRKLYFSEQAPSAIPFPSASAEVPDEYVGLTALQIMNTYGLSLGGELAPPNAVSDPSIVGLLDP